MSCFDLLIEVMSFPNKTSYVQPEPSPENFQ